MRKTWEECNKPYVLTQDFFHAMNENVFKNGKPTKSYFAVYNFFKKTEEPILNLLHEFIMANRFTRKLTMTEFFTAAQQWNMKTKVAVVTETQTKNYLEALKQL